MNWKKRQIGYKRMLISVIAMTLLSACASREEVAKLNRSLEMANKRIDEIEDSLKSSRQIMADNTAAMDKISSDLNEIRGTLDDISRRSGIQTGGGSVDINERLFSLLQEMRSDITDLKVKQPEATTSIPPTIPGFPPASPGSLEPPLKPSATPAIPLPLTPAVTTQPSFVPTPAAPIVVTTAPVPTPSTIEATGMEELYRTGYSAIEAKNWELARSRFTEFLSKYPASDLADNSQYWIGESYYSEKKYEEAVIAFDKVVEKYPASDKVCTSIFKQGLSLVGLNYPSDAKLAFEKAISKCPGTEEAKLSRQKLDKLPR